MGSTSVIGTVALVALAVAFALAFLAVLPMGGHSPSSPSSSTTSTGTYSTTSTSSITSSTFTSSSITSSTTSTTSTSTSTSSATSNSSSTRGSPQYSASAPSVQGLELKLSINATAILPGQTVQVNVSEFNSLETVNNVSSSSHWLVRGALSSCPNTNSQPFGIAVYQGHYTAQNISQGSQLQIFPITACPQYIRLVTGYSFQPLSNEAIIEPGSGYTPMAATIGVNGSYGPSYTGSSAANSFGQGVYTLVAADEWGALVFLYFQVA